MNNLFKGLVFFIVSALAACATPSGEDGRGTSDELQTLVPEQIEDIGEFMLNTARTVAYSGHRRYVGIRIRAEKGVKIRNFVDIERFGLKPVTAIADEGLHVLDREVGGSIS